MPGWRPLTAALVLAAGMVVAPPAVADQELTVYPVGDDPAGLTVDPSTGIVYVANRSRAQIDVIDPATGVTDQIDVPAPVRSLAVDPDARRLYYGEELGVGPETHITALDLDTHAELGSLTGPRWPADMALDPATDRLYVNDIVGTRTWVIDAATMSPIAQVFHDGGASPTGLALDADHSRAFVATQSTPDGISVVDTRTNTADSAFGAPRAFWVAVDPDRARVFATYVTEQILRVYDTDTHELLAAIPLPGQPFGVATDPVNDRVYVANDNGDVSILSSSQMQILHTVHVTSRPYLVEPSTATRSAFVTDLGFPGTVTHVGGRFLRPEPRRIDLTDVPAGQSATGTARFTAAGSGAVAVRELAFTGADAARFTVTSDRCSDTSLPAGSSCDVAFTVAPSAGATAEAVLEVTSDDEDGARQVPVGVAWAAPRQDEPPQDEPPPPVVTPTPEAPVIEPEAPRTTLRVTARPKNWRVSTAARTRLVSGVTSNGRVAVRTRCRVPGADSTPRRLCGLRVKRAPRVDPVTAAATPRVRVSAAPRCSAVRMTVIVRARAAGAEPVVWQRTWRTDPTPRIPCGVTPR